VIRNTDFVVGMVVFTGMESKIMQNSAKPKYKFSKLELLTNKAIVIVFVMQFLLASSGAILGANWMVNNRSHLWMNENC